MLNRILLIVSFVSIFFGCSNAASKSESAPESSPSDSTKEVIVGAQRTELYLPILKGKKVGLYSNHTGMVSADKHTLDVLKDNDIDVVCAFSPEHGFRGTADAGEKVSSSVDPATGVEIVSLYGSGKAEAMEKAMDNIDVVVVDIQDVGLRFYTYYCTMLELMNSAAAKGKEVVVLDRPNPNGMYIDGPILDMKYSSGVGRLPIPVVHGLTLAEMAQMINGEGWLKDGRHVKLSVVPCDNYTHSTRYELPIAPSPNLRTMRAIYLYPSICYFEATPVSLGRGTDKPFEIYGHPAMTGRKFSFTPESRPGAKEPPQKNVKCYGVDLSDLDNEEIIARGINLEYLIDAYKDVTAHSADKKFFTSFFEKLIGTPDIRTMIENGMSADEIKATWTDDVEKFRLQRRPYLLYSE